MLHFHLHMFTLPTPPTATAVPAVLEEIERGWSTMLHEEHQVAFEKDAGPADIAETLAEYWPEGAPTHGTVHILLHKEEGPCPGHVFLTVLEELFPGVSVGRLADVSELSPAPDWMHSWSLEQARRAGACSPLEREQMVADYFRYWVEEEHVDDSRIMDIMSRACYDTTLAHSLHEIDELAARRMDVAQPAGSSYAEMLEQVEQHAQLVRTVAAVPVDRLRVAFELMRSWTMPESDHRALRAVHGIADHDLQEAVQRVAQRNHSFARRLLSAVEATS